jgi:hypothetical protein
MRIPLVIILRVGVVHSTSVRKLLATRRHSEITLHGWGSWRVRG